MQNLLINFDIFLSLVHSIVKLIKLLPSVEIPLELVKSVTVALVSLVSDFPRVVMILRTLKAFLIRLGTAMVELGYLRMLLSRVETMSL